MKAQEYRLVYLIIRKEQYRVLVMSTNIVSSSPSFLLKLKRQNNFIKNKIHIAGIKTYVDQSKSGKMV